MVLSYSRCIAVFAFIVVLLAGPVVGAPATVAPSEAVLAEMAAAAQATPDRAPVAAFDRIELVPVAAPAGFEHSVTYQVAYFQTVDGQSREVFPARADKEKDLDLTLAQVIRQVIVNEYEANGRHVNDTALMTTTKKEILDLVTISQHGTKWTTEGRKVLARYLTAERDRLSLHRLHATLDYKLPGGTQVGAVDIDPVLVRFADGEERDLITVILVTANVD